MPDHKAGTSSILIYFSIELAIIQLMAGGGVALIGITLVPLLSGLF